MSVRSRALSLLVMAIIVLAAGAVPAWAQNIDFRMVPRVTLGLTNQGPNGAICSTGWLNFTRSTAPGAVIGTLTSGSEVLCGSDPLEPFTFDTGSLTVFTANQSVMGTLGGERLFGQLLPAGHGIIAIDTFRDGGNALIDGVGLTALIERGGATFTKSNLAGTWRIVALSGEQGFGPGTSQTVFGFITIDAAGQVTGGTLVHSFFSESIVGGNVTVTADGQLTGFIETSDGEVSSVTDVQGLMAPDKNFIAGVSMTNGFSSFENGMFFMQREPTGTTFSTGDLAGVWYVFSLQAVADDSSAGNVFRGTVTFDSAGNIIASDLITGDGFRFPAVDSGGFTVIPQGFIEGEVSFVNESFLGTLATMFKEKNQIIGVNIFEDGVVTTFGLFMMVRQGPPPPASVVQFRSGNFSAQEGMPASIIVDRTGAITTAITVDFAVSDPLLDESPAIRTLSFRSNERSLTFSVPTAGNPFRGPDRRLNLVLSNPTNGATLGPRSTANLNVLDDDSTFDFEKTTFTVSEKAGKAPIRIKRFGALAFPASVLFTAVDDRGVTLVSRNVSFAKGIDTATVDVPVKDNTDLDGNRTVVLQLFSPTVLVAGAGLPKPTLVAPNPTATLTVIDDDTAGMVSLSSATYSGNEGTRVRITIVRSPATPGALLGGNVSVPYFTSDNNSATAGFDYTAVEGSVTFTGRETVKTLDILLTGDGLAGEGLEHFLFNLGTPSNGATLGRFPTARVNVNDIDRAGTVFFSQAAYKVSETAGAVDITVMRTGGTASASVQFRTLAGTAGFQLGSPAVPAGGASGLNDIGWVVRTLSFDVGQTKKVVSVPIFNDNIGEGDEVFFVVLQNAQGGLKIGSPSNSSVTIVDDEVVLEFSGKFRNNQPEVVRRGPKGASVSVQYFATSGTALIDEDFRLKPGTLVFGPGVTSRTIPISTLNDNIAEGTENFTITLLNPSPPAQLGPNFEQVFALDDNDFGGTLNFANTSSKATLGSTQSMMVRRSGGAGTVMRVGWAAIGGTAIPGTDFWPAAGEFTYQAGETVEGFSVEISAAFSAAGKTIVFGLMPPGLDSVFKSSRLGAANVSTVTIMGAPPSVIQFSKTTYSVAEDQGVATITVKRTGDLSQPATVNYATSNGTATTVNEDYSPASGTLTFPASDSSYQTVSFTVNVTDDGGAEGTETVNLTLSNVSPNAILGERSTAVLEINDPQGPYNFTVLYSGDVNNVGLPSINDSGVFSFLLNGAQQIVFTGNIDTPSSLRTALTVPNALVNGLPGVRTPVDSGETVAAVANLPSGAGIVLGFNNSPNVVFSNGSAVSEPAYSLNGNLAFAGIDDGCDGPCDALFLGTRSGVTVAVRAGDTVPGVDFLSGIGNSAALAVPGVDFLSQIRNSAAVNDNGVAAFVGTTFGGAIGVYTTSGDGAISTVSSTVDETYVQYGQSLSINNFGAVAFIGFLPDGESSVVVGFNGSTIPIATTSPDGFVAFNNSNSASPVLANTELVAFFASLADETEGIFTGPDPVAHKVVRTGDIIDGRTVIDVALGGINAQGQISFRALLYDGEVFEQAAIVATPTVRCCSEPLVE